MLIGLSSIFTPRHFCRRIIWRRPPAAHKSRPLGRDDRRAIAALIVLFVPMTLLLGDLRTRATPSRCGPTLRPTEPSISSICAGEIPDHLVSGLQSIHDLRLHAFGGGAVDGAGPARPRALDRHQNGVRLLRRCALEPDHGDCGASCRRRQIELALASRLLRRHHGRRALYFADRTFAGVEDRSRAYLSMLMGVWLATCFVGGFIAGWLGCFWSTMDKPKFFLMIAAIAAVAGAAIVACRWVLRGMLNE